jgi:glycosyltransferase involved in cell wall biosynthesis
MPTPANPGIALVVSGFPRRSETFALAEILALEAHGLLAGIFATKPGDGQPPHPDLQRLQTPVHYLDGETAAVQADCLVAHLANRPVAAIHAYFAHTPAEVAALAARRLGLPFGFSAHARDVRKVAPAELARRGRQAACVVACNEDTAASLSALGISVELVPHGVDTGRFIPHPLPSAPGSTTNPVRLLAVGRLVEKKGFAVLVEAVNQLSVPFRLRIIGDGPERDSVEAAIRASRHPDWIELCAGQTHADLPQAYAEAHILVAPAVVDRSGDRDGLPNVVLEAMASGRPVVASGVGAIGSAIRHGQDGVLVAPGDPAALAGELDWLARRPELWTAFGRSARARVEAVYERHACTERFCRLLEKTYLRARVPVS